MLWKQDTLVPRKGGRTKTYIQGTLGQEQDFASKEVQHKLQGQEKSNM
jgi:hypothetical protein